MGKDFRSLNNFINLADINLDKEQPYIIAEVGNSHDGSLGMAHSFIDNIAAAGAHAVKFQTHIARAESTFDEQFRVNFSYADKNRFNYWQRLEFSVDQWRELKKHAHDVGLDFLSTPFSVCAINLLAGIGVNVWKVSSGEIAAPDMLSRLVNLGDPVIVSTGMSNYAEIDLVVEKLRQKKIAFALLQCTTMYPTPLNYVGLNTITDFGSKYGCIAGFSDHSGSLSPSITAMARGCKLFELHVTFSKEMFGPDQSSSLTFKELSELTAFADDLYTMDNSPYSKNEVAQELCGLKEMFGKSLALNSFQPAGTKITYEMLAYKKPAGGLTDSKDVIGKTLLIDKDEHWLLERTDVE
jgi:N,N'-diacetyllegionaminate synthase